MRRRLLLASFLGTAGLRPVAAHSRPRGRPFRLGVMTRARREEPGTTAAILIEEQWPDLAGAGGTFGANVLAGYGPRFDSVATQLAAMTAKIIGGVLPADIPVEQPNKFELAVNLKTARTLGVTIPPSILARADEVIE